MVIPPKYAVSEVVETIKKNTSRSLSRKFAFWKKVYWDKKRHLGQRVFYIYGRNKRRRVIRRYIESQEEKK